MEFYCSQECQFRSQQDQTISELHRQKYIKQLEPHLQQIEQKDIVDQVVYLFTRIEFMNLSLISEILEITKTEANLALKKYYERKHNSQPESSQMCRRTLS